MSVICQNFVENTWRKDLCSNCFKSAADHSGKEHLSSDGYCGQRYISQAASIYQNRHTSPARLPWLTLMCSPISNDKIRDPFYALHSYTSSNNVIDSSLSRSNISQKDMSKGILKDISGRKSQRKATVSFVTDQPLVIGYGGNDYDSDESPWDLASDDDSVSIDGLDVTEEDRTLTRITKSNTEFNAINRNLLDASGNREESDSGTVTLDFDEEDSYQDKSDTSSKVDQNIDLRNLIKYSDKLEEKLRRSYFTTNENNLPTRTSEPFKSTSGTKERCFDTRVHLNNDRHSQVNDAGVKSKVEQLNKRNLSTFLFGESDFARRDESTICATTKELTERAGDNTNADFCIKQTGGSMFPTISDLKIDSCEQSSDSDYSTSRQTSSELSTDSESFNDTEEAPVVPCTSFLHSFMQKNGGTNLFDKGISPEKTYYPPSSSSGNVSDESDSIGSSTKTANESDEICSPKEENRESISQVFSPLTTHHGFSSSETTFEPKDNRKHSGHDQNRSFETFGKVANSEKTYNLVSSECVTGESDKAVQRSKITKEHNEFTSQKDELGNSLSSALPIEKSQSYENFSVIPQTSPFPATKGDSEGSPNFHSVTEDASELDSKNQILRVTTDEVKFASSESSSPVDKSSVSGKPSDQEVALVPPSPSVQVNSSTSSLSKADRHAKLAALAFELEQARCDSLLDNVSSLEVNSPDTPSKPTPTKVGGSPASAYRLHKSASGSSLETAYYGHNLSGSCDSTTAKSGNDSLLSTPRSKLINIPDPSKIKGKFSFKKLLKKSKDHSSTFPNNGEHSLKAWKRNHFDRSRLSLEIVHPMDLQRNTASSTESTPTDDRNTSAIFEDPAGYGRNMATRRARSLSALPNLPISSSETSEETALRSKNENSPSTSSLNRKVGNHSSKSSPCSERDKKAKAPMRRPSLSTPRSGSSSSSSSTPNIRSGGSKRPPKPPPPPRETPPLSVTQNNRTNSGGETGNSVPARPPPPKGFIRKDSPPKVTSKDVLPNTETERNANPDSDSDYANLGDIRSHIAPKKPQRQSVPSKEDNKVKVQNSDFEDPGEPCPSESNAYEVLEVTEEEDHYTYLDESEVTNNSMERSTQEVAKSRQQLHSEDSLPKSAATDCSASERNMSCCQPNHVQHTASLTFGATEKKPWFDLQTSYEAITASNYESLAELITTAFNEEAEHLQKNSACLRWSNFELESSEPIQILGDKVVYNAICKVPQKTKVTVMLTTEKHHMTQISRNSRVPVLASFNDYVHSHHVKTGANVYSPPGVTKATIYVLQRSKITTVNQFALDSSCFQMNQHVHLRNACFVLLQLIHNLKNLQADGIEKIEYDLSRIFLVHTDADKPPIMLLLTGDKTHLTRKLSETEHYNTLCQVTLKVMFHLLQISQLKDLSTCVVNGERLATAVVNAFTAVAEVLSEEKAASLTQAKGLLEYMLWGPVDVSLTPGPPAEHVNIILQRWLDLQRARMIKALVSNLQMKIYSHSGLHIYEEYQLIFLLQSTVKSLKDVISKI